MIRHIALFRFHPDHAEADIIRLLAGFEDLVDQVDGFRGVHVGANMSPEHLDQGFAHGIIGDFASMDAFERYLAHDAHKALAARVAAALQTGIEQDVIAFDFDIAEPAL